MTAPQATVTIATQKPATRRRPLVIGVLRRPNGAIGFAILLLVVVACLGASIWAPYDPLANDLGNSLAPPSLEHLLGTDQLGRDVFSRILYGGVPSLTAAFQVAVVAIVLAVPLGLVSGYSGGRTDRFLMRIVDFGLAIPGLIFVLVTLSIFRDRLDLAYFVLGVLLVPTAARIIRGAALNVRNELYIDAARVSGVGTWRIVFRHVLPRVIGPILVQASLLFAVGVIMTAGLAYLGFGPPPPEPSWGGLVAESLSLLNRSPWLMIGIGTIMGVVVVALGVLGDAIRDETVESWAPPAYRLPRRRRTSDRGRSGSREQAVTGDAAPDALLEVRGLDIAYPDGEGWKTVVQDATFRLERGEILGVVGESGCGKTTIARAVLGLLRSGGRIAGGEVLFDGVRLDLLGPEEFRALRGSRISYVSQEPMAALDPSMRVGPLVAAAVRHHTGLSDKDARARTLELFRLVQLREPENVYRLYPHQVSGGMAQRIALARALAGGPDLLVADEPTTALDVRVQAEVIDLLRDLRDRTGLGILLITHDWGVVAEICDRAIVMYAGEIVETAAVQRLIDRPEHPYTRALLRSNPGLLADGATRLPTVTSVVAMAEGSAS